MFKQRNKLKDKIKQLEYDNKRLEKDNRWMRSYIEDMPVEIKEWFIDNDQELNWLKFADDFEFCEHCGFDYKRGEGHYNSSTCPVAFKEMCDDFIDETGNGNSTRSLIWMLHDQLMSRGDEKVLSWVSDYHRYQLLPFSEEEIELDFDKWLVEQKEAGETLSSLLLSHLWTYEQNRQCLNEWLVELWTEDFEAEREQE